jgi:hypothetical protein
VPPRIDRQQVNSKRVYIYLDFPKRLGGVGVHQDAVLVGDRREFSDGLDCAHFVVGMHHGHEYRIRCDGPLQIGWINETLLIDLQNCQTKPLAFQPPTDFGDRRVLHS